MNLYAQFSPRCRPVCRRIKAVGKRPFQGGVNVQTARSNEGPRERENGPILRERSPGRLAHRAVAHTRATLPIRALRPWLLAITLLVV